ATFFLFVCACATSGGSAPAAAPASAAAAASTIDATGPAATAVLEPRSGSTVSGTAKFSAARGGALGVHVELQGATPGAHGLHIHEKGDCSDPKAASAGAHYNPNAGAHHGGPATAVRHGGDLGNITVDSNGKGTADVTVPDLSLDSPGNGVVGKSIV